MTLLNEHADYSYPLVYRFLDKRFNSKQRFQAICDNLRFLPEKLTALSAPIYKTPLSFGEVIPDIIDDYTSTDGRLLGTGVMA